MKIKTLDYSNLEVIDRITHLTEGLNSFWGSSDGWAPIKSAELLTKSRLDWQLSLAKCLNFFLTTETQKEEGALILAWSTLGSLTEGVLKLFLSVWYTDYESSIERSDLAGFRNKNNNLIDPDVLVLEKLRVFMDKEVFPIDFRELWKDTDGFDIIEWILKIQQRRNAIHAFKDRDIGDFDDFFYELQNFLIFMRRLTGTFPYPYDGMEPQEI